MTRYQKTKLVMNYLKSLGINVLTIGRAIDDDHWELSYKLISENPNIDKKEFLKRTGIKECQKALPDKSQMMVFKIDDLQDVQ